MATYELPWNVRRVSGPAVEPVSVDEAMAQALTSCDEDRPLLKNYIAEARELVESLQWRTLITTTWRQTLDAFPCGAIELWMPPLQSVTSIAYVDTAGDSQTLSASLYDVDTNSEPGRVTPAHGTSWPATRCQPGAVQITYVAGYGDAAPSVPRATRRAILMLVSRMALYREGEAELLTDAIESLLAVESLRAVA